MDNTYLCSEDYFKGKWRELNESNPKYKPKMAIPIPFGSSTFTERFEYFKHGWDYYLYIPKLNIKEGYVKLCTPLLLSVLGVDVGKHKEEMNDE